MKNKASKKQRKGGTTKTKPRQWRASPPVVGIPAPSRKAINKSSSRSSAAELSEELPEQHQATAQSGDLADISEVGFGGGESAFQLLEEGQDLEGELLLAFGVARDDDQSDVQLHRQSQERVPDYKNRHRM